jgi:hypothetical protein
MRKLITQTGVSGRLLAFLALLGAFTLTQGCSQLLDVDNPDEILADDLLNDPGLVEQLAVSAVGEFQNSYDDPIIWVGSMITDEQITGINWENTARISQRILEDSGTGQGGMFGNISRMIVMADTAVALLSTVVDNPGSDGRIALASAFGGYSYVFMAETLCEATIKVSDRIFSSDEVMQMAIPRFEQAIQVGQAAGRSDLVNLARTGLARAHLWLGNWDQVKAAAGPVPEDFVYWAYYSTNSGRENNTLFARISGANHALGVHPRFVQGEWLQQGLVETQIDPRIQHLPDWRTGHNALSPLYTPFAGRRLSVYNGEAQAFGGEPASYTQDMNIAIADGIEARHHYAEADGPTQATLDFVNARRAYGNMDPLVDPTPAELMEELREQRARDTYMGGIRLGDLRRWDKQGVGNFFPTGQHPTEEWGLYGDAECFPIPDAEFEGNPNISR